MKTLGLCCDHAGYELKEYVKQILDSKGLAYKDFGTCSTESCDYPDFAHPLAKAVEAGDKHQGIRAALCWMEEIARLAREHNDANILVMPGRFISQEEATHTVEAFLNTSFEGGRHQRRIDKIPL